MAAHEDPSGWIADACMCDQLAAEALTNDARMSPSTDSRP